MWKSCSPIFTVYQRSTAQFWGEGNLSLRVSPLAPLHPPSCMLMEFDFGADATTIASLRRAEGKTNSLAKRLCITGMNSDPCPHHLSQPEHRADPSSRQGSLSHLPLSRPTPKPSFVTSGGRQVPSSFTKLRMGKRRSMVSHVVSAFPQLLTWIKWSCLVCPSQVTLSITVYEAISLSLSHHVCPGGSSCVWGHP